MRVAVCDDDRECILQIRQFTEMFYRNVGETLEFMEFSSGEEIISWMESAKDTIELLILDVEMDGISGIDVKNELMHEDLVKRIVFFTSHGEAMPMAFGLKVMNFYEKPLLYEAFEKLIFLVQSELQENQYISFATSEGLKGINTEEIIYIQSHKDYSEIQCKNGERIPLIIVSMKAWEDKLRCLSFVRVHKSYIINMAYITRMKEKVELNHSLEKITVGRTYRETARKNYEEYVRNKIRGRIR